MAQDEEHDGAEAPPPDGAGPPGGGPLDGGPPDEAPPDEAPPDEAPPDGAPNGAALGDAPPSRHAEAAAAAIAAARDAETASATGNPAAEQALLAGLLANNEALLEVADILEPEHFSIPLLGRIYHACRVRHGQARVANAITMRQEFENDPDLVDLGGVDYLDELQESWVRLSELRGYASAIRDSHLRGQIVRFSEEAARDARAPVSDETAEDLLERLESSVFQLAETGEMHRQTHGARSSAEAALDWVRRAHEGDPDATPIRTGLTALDEMIGGFYRTDFSVLAGRPGMGKTALALHFSLEAARGSSGGRPQAVLFFSMEMSHDQLAGRILAQSLGDPDLTAHSLRRGQVSEEQLEGLAKAARNLENLPLFIDDSPYLTVGATRARARRLKRRLQSRDLGYDLGFVVVDYLQLMTPGTRRENRVQEISQITRELKALAKDLRVPVLALSQLSRAPEAREEKRPALSDLRDSGTIEQDSDLVMMLYRESFYLQQQEPRDSDSSDQAQRRWKAWKERSEEAHGTAEIIVAKHRHGPSGVARVGFDQRKTSFGDRPPGGEEPPPPGEDDF